jgi:nuclear transport factor 2 (NTF2) superfamily protein
MTAEDAVVVVKRMTEAWDEMDWDGFAAHWHPDSTYEFVSQVSTNSLTETLAYERNNRIKDMHVERDLWTADENGRVWWRFAVQWPDEDTGLPRETTGASTALVVDGLIASLVLWIDVSFLLTV